jgi:hypothetical protein
VALGNHGHGAYFCARASDGVLDSAFQLLN